MGTTELLQADHSLLRTKAALLESVLQIGPEARLMLREVTYSLMRLLDAHSQREHALLQRYYQQAPLRGFTAAMDHAVEQQLLRSANRMLTGQARASVPLIILRLSQAMEQLRVQMERQERFLFSCGGEAGEIEEAGALPLDGAMSVNEILHRYPRASNVFEDLRISRLDEGSDSVDEVAWRHGIDASEVLERLRSAVAGQPSYWYGE